MIYNRPLVTIAITDKGLYSVHCAACPGAPVQITGVGGFKNPKDAQARAQRHRGDHLEALQQEMLNSDAQHGHLEGQ